MNELTSRAKNIKLKNVDELFYTDEIREKKEGGYKVNSSEGGRDGTLGYEIISRHRRKRAAELAALYPLN